MAASFRGSLPRWHWQCCNGIEQLLLVLRSLFAFAVIAQVVLGLGAAEQKALFDDFEIWSGGLFSLPLAWPGTPRCRRSNR